jgi:hypothetical protein
MNYLACNRNEYQKQEKSVSGEWNATGKYEADSFTAVCESIVWTVMDPRQLTTL